MGVAVVGGDVKVGEGATRAQEAEVFEKLGVVAACVAAAGAMRVCELDQKRHTWLPSLDYLGVAGYGYATSTNLHEQRHPTN